MKRFVLAALALALPLCGAIAQQPVQWRYDMQNGVATASYPGNVVVAGATAIGDVKPLPRMSKQLAAIKQRLPGSYATIWIDGDSTAMGVAYGSPGSVAGVSGGAGVSPNTNLAKGWSWPGQIYNALLKNDVPASYDSFIGTQVRLADTVTDYNAYQNQVVVNSTWAVGTVESAGLRMWRKATADTTEIVFTPADKSTHLDVLYANVSGNYAVLMDGVQVAAWAGDGSASVGLFKIPVQVEGSHVWSFRTTSAATANVIGAIARNAVSPRVDVVNAGARQQEMYNQAGFGTGITYINAKVLPVIAPDLYILGSGINDVRTGGGNRSVADLNNSMNALLNAAPYDKMLVSPNNIAPASDTGTGAHMSDLFALYDVQAASRGLNLVSVRSISGPYSIAVLNGRMFDDLHLLDRDVPVQVGDKVVKYVLSGGR